MLNVDYIVAYVDYFGPFVQRITSTDIIGTPKA